MKISLVLASTSPRRAQFLNELNIQYEVCNPNVDENMEPGKSASNLALELALKKAKACYEQDKIILGMDTVVVARSTVLGKPVDAEDARRMLKRLSGQTHRVITGVALLWNRKRAVSSETTRVTFRKLTASEIQWYVDSGEPFDKAGAYGIQGLGRLLIKKVDGCYFNVVGFPVNGFLSCLERLGFSVYDLIGSRL